MRCTVIEFPGRKELYYGAQEATGNKGTMYEVSEEHMNLIRTCDVDKVQEVINLICQTSQKIGSITTP